MAVTKHCAREIQHRNTKNNNIVIYSDNQGTLKAIRQLKISSKLVKDYALEEIEPSNRLTVSWVAGYEGHPGNEETDKLNKKGSNKWN